MDKKAVWQALNRDLAENEERFLGELFDFLKIPTVSTDPHYRDAMSEGAQWVADALRRAGCQRVEIWETKHHPAVFGSYEVDPSAPTILVYGHYDVQPPDPLELWETPPFSPQLRDGRIYARGSADDKGQLFMHIKALDLLHQKKMVRCNVKFIIEGEEEIGSPNLSAILAQKKAQLKADVVLVSDTAMHGKDEPTITVSLRGLAYIEVKVKGPNRDLHSGVYGGVVENPAIVLAKLIAQLKDEKNRITIPSFYDKVKPISEEVKAYLERILFDEEQYKASVGVKALATEEGYSALEAAGLRPSLDVNGMWSGYSGPGAKTVLPAVAGAKISMRLVPDQDPEEIAELALRYLQQLAPPTVELEVTRHHGGLPFWTDMKTPAYKTAEEALKWTYGKTPLPSFEGGSIPILATMHSILQIPIVLLGFGLPTDAIHSPNEHFHVEQFRKGIQTILAYHLLFEKP